MSSCSQFDYVSKKWDTKVVLDSSSSNSISKNRTVIEKNDTGGFEVKVYNKDNQLIEHKNYLDTNKKTVYGEVKYWYDDGKLKRIENYNKKEQLDGEVISYYSNGNLKRRDKFKNDEFVSGECFTEDGNPTIHTPFFIEPFIDVANMSVFINYPEKLRKEGIQEKVVLKVMINKENQITRYSYDSDNSIEFVNVAIKSIIEYGNPKAGLIDNEPVTSWILVPVIFKLRD